MEKIDAVVLEIWKNYIFLVRIDFARYRDSILQMSWDLSLKSERENRWKFIDVCSQGAWREKDYRCLAMHSHWSSLDNKCITLGVDLVNGEYDVVDYFCCVEPVDGGKFSRFWMEE